jgi:4-hydroxy-tetrahydrodipicolinate synthase
MLQGCLAAAVTPLKDGGTRLDEAAFAPYVAWLARGGVDGVLALGTTGEGLLLDVAERERALELFVAAARGSTTGRFHIAAHCGAATTRDTCRLAAHARRIGADAVAVIGPSFFTFDEEALLAHFASAAQAALGAPFYAYEFASRTGYGLSPSFLRRLRAVAPNLVGLKVSNPRFEDVAPFLDPSLGLDVFLGAEALIRRGLAAGAKGAVSGLAALFPEIVAAHVRAPDEAGENRVSELRRRLNALPFHAATKIALAARGVPLRGDVRAPLRGLTAEEAAAARALAAAD